MRATLDYYLVEPDAILVEEFVSADDHTAVGLTSAAWTAAECRWAGSAALSQGIRTDPALRARVSVVDRAGAADAYHRLGGGDLPDEATLRTRFHDLASLAVADP